MPTIKVTSDQLDVTNVDTGDPKIEVLKQKLSELVQTHEEFKKYSGLFEFTLTNGKIFYAYLGDEVNDPKSFAILRQIVDDLIAEIKKSHP